MSVAPAPIALLSGREYFDAVFEAIDDARHEVQVETYVFRFDRTGEEFLRRAAGAAARGVRVSMLADGLGSPELTGAAEARVRAMGIDLIVHRRPGVARVTRLHGRMHRKLVVVDQRVLFIGGINISDEYAGYDVPGAYLDFGVRAEGEIAVDASRLAHTLFHEASLRPGMRFWTRLRKRGAPRAADRSSWLVIRDNQRRQKDIEHAYRAGIRSAERSLLLAHAYFLPSRNFVEEICRASRRGVEATLLLQGRSEHGALRWAERRLYDRLLRAGVRVYEYEACLLHAKVATVDSRWSTIGSSNLEPWSLISNLEINLVSEDPALASAIEGALRSRLESECSLVEARAMGPLARAISALAYETVLAVFVLTGGRRDLAWRLLVAPRPPRA